MDFTEVETTIRNDRADKYKELETYKMKLPPQPLSLGLSGVLEKISQLGGMLNRVEEMKEEALRQTTIAAAIADAVEAAYEDTFAALMQSGVRDAEGKIVLDSEALHKLRSTALQEAAALKDANFADIAKKRRRTAVDKTLAKGYLSAVESRYDRLDKVGFELSATREVLLKVQPYSTIAPSREQTSVSHGEHYSDTSQDPLTVSAQS